MAGAEPRERGSSNFCSGCLSGWRKLAEVDEGMDDDDDDDEDEEEEKEEGVGDGGEEEHEGKGEGDMAGDSTGVIGAPSSRKKSDDQGTEVLKREPHKIRKSTKVSKSRVLVRRELRTAGRLCKCSDPSSWGPIFLLF